MSEDHIGSCLCGNVRFNVRSRLRGVVYCHCSQCQKQTGHFYAATSAPVDALSVSGEDHVTWFEASESARRGFCRTCGSALFWRSNGSNEISIMAGAFEKPTELKGAKHIFAADKGDYYDIADGLPVFPGSSR